ncbi:MAG TPA: ATP-binding protein [Elusimicrobiota bacterium]|nr:ATP-binding protein [Elusimicrobiota bacterium]
MAKPKHVLILSNRAEVLERIYDTPVSSAVTLTVAPGLNEFAQLSQRYPFHGHILDMDLTEKQTWQIFQDTKLRQPTAFFSFLMGKTPEEGLQDMLNGAAGWFVLYPPYPVDKLEQLKELLPKQPTILFDPPDPPAGKNFAEIRPFFKKADTVTAATLPAVAEALAKNPKALAVLRVPRTETSLGAFLRDAGHDRPDARLLVVCDQPLDEASRTAVHSSGWVAVPAPHGVPYLLDRLQESHARAETDRPPTERILVVDDEPNILDFVVDILTEHGYEVDGYPSGTTAVAAMKSKEYHVALVDFQLGDMTGLTLSRELRQIDPDLNVILMTAHASLDMAVKAIQADVYDYLIKPVDTNHLKRSLGKALEKRRLALEIKALVADLQKANHQLNRLNDLKSRFLSIVTHDLRTPLTSIKGYAQVLTMQKTLPSEQQQHFLKIIAHETDHLAGLISDLMDFVSIEAGKLRVEKTSGSIVELVEAVGNRMASLAEQRKIVFQVEADPAALPELLMDKRRIDQVLTNLVSNAFKHTPEGGSVKVRAETQKSDVRLQVIDSGEGIPPGDLPRIFEQFYQVESHASKRDGIGLGLAIAKEIIQAHGGEIGVNSDGVGRGSCFWFTLPIPEKSGN